MKWRYGELKAVLHGQLHPPGTFYVHIVVYVLVYVLVCDLVYNKCRLCASFKDANKNNGKRAAKVVLRGNTSVFTHEIGASLLTTVHEIRCLSLL